jgi:outer membrane protein assembly factor BamB
MHRWTVTMVLCLAVTSPSSAEDSPKPDLGTRKSGTDWPKFLGPTGDSKSSEKGLVTPWPAEGPKIVWQKALGIGFGPVAVSRGRLYEFSRHLDNARLTCLNSETGEELWKFEYETAYDDYFGYDTGPRCGPVVDDDRVYIYGAEGMLHCVDAFTGKQIWKVDTFKKFNVKQNFFGVGAAPLVEGDLLITVVGGSPADMPDVGLRLDLVKPNGSGIVAFDKRTGEVKYKLGDELAGYAAPAAATIDGRRWCFVFARGGLLGFEPAAGKLDFHFPWRARSLECVNASNPVVVDDNVLISECYGVGAAVLKVKADGAKPGGYDVVWSDERKGRRKSLMTHWNTAIHHDGYVYGCSGRHPPEAELRCVELATGKVAWIHDGRKAEDDPNLGRSSLMYVDGHFICLTENGELILLKASASKYEEVSRVTLHDKRKGTPPPGFGPPALLKYPAWAAPVLSHGLLYLRGEDGLRARDGSRLVCLEVIK